MEPVLEFISKAFFLHSASPQVNSYVGLYKQYSGLKCAEAVSSAQVEI